jgi:HD superfamily phosphohydrolase
MDYLLRDSLYCGVSYGNYDLHRLISSLAIFQLLRKYSSIPVSLSSESEIIKNLTKPINIVRIYAKKGVYDKAKSIYEQRQREAN